MKRIEPAMDDYLCFMIVWNMLVHGRAIKTIKYFLFNKQIRILQIR